MLKDHNINLNVNDIKSLFHKYDRTNSGLLKYDDLFNDLKVGYFLKIRISIIMEFDLNMSIIYIER